jgi:nucleoside-diphosphate-sugar epimerase
MASVSNENQRKTALIFGGNGKVSRALTPLLTGATPPWKVYSIIRNPDQSPALEQLGAETLVQSVEDAGVEELAATIRKAHPDVAIWLAGAGGGDPSRTESVDHLGAIKAMDACAKEGIKRFIVVSALDIRDRNLEPPSWYDENDLKRSERIWTVIGPYMRAKFAADKELVTGNDKRKLDYTIVRPGQLTDEDAKGTISAGHVHLGNPVSRADVAQAIIETIKNDGTIGMAFDVLGGDKGIKEAIEQVVAQKADCFKGFY